MKPRDTTRCPLCNGFLEAKVIREVHDIAINDDCEITDWTDGSRPELSTAAIQCENGHSYAEICAAITALKLAAGRSEYARFTFDKGVLGTAHCIRLTNGSVFVIRENASQETLSLAVVECEGPIDELTAEDPDWWFAQLNYDGVMPYMSCSQEAMVQLCTDLHVPGHAATNDNEGESNE